MVYTLSFFSSKCSLFHNSNIFGSYIIHILYTGCAKIKKKNSGAKRFCPCTRHEIVYRIGGIAPQILVDVRYRLVVSLTPLGLLPLGDVSHLLVEYEDRWAPQGVWKFRRQKSLASDGIRT